MRVMAISLKRLSIVFSRRNRDCGKNTSDPTQAVTDCIKVQSSIQTTKQTVRHSVVIIDQWYCDLNGWKTRIIRPFITVSLLPQTS
jgi:hypothetical protein